MITSGVVKVALGDVRISLNTLFFRRCVVSFEALSQSHSCVIVTSGAVLCWGYEGYNQVGGSGQVSVLCI